MPAGLLRLVRRPRHPQERPHGGAGRPGRSREPRTPVPEVLDRVQRRLPRPRRAAGRSDGADRRQGRGPVPGRRLGRGARAGRRAGRGGGGRRRRRERPERALHRDVLHARLRVPDAVLQPARRDRGRPRQRVQQGRSRRARVRLRHVPRRLRSPHGGRRGGDHGVGREPLGQRSPRPRALAGGGAGRGHRRGPDPDGHRRAGRPAPPALPRLRRRAGVRDHARDRAGRALRPRVPVRRTRSGRRSSSACCRPARRSGASRPPACPRPRSSARPGSTRAGPRSCGSGRGFSASRRAGTSCAPSPFCPRSRETWAGRAAASCT